MANDDTSVDPASWGCTCKNDGIRLVRSHYACPFHGETRSTRRKLDAIKTLLRLENMPADDRITMALAVLDAW